MYPRILHIYGPLWINSYGVMIALGVLVFAVLTLHNPIRKKIIDCLPRRPAGKLRITDYKTIDDWPSMNFFIRRNDFLAVGGFDENYWPGEDTALCHNLLKAEKKIIYCPDVLVYHHRRKNLAKHLKQAGQFGWHRGLFAKKFPVNSRKIKYFLPSLFSLFVLFGWLLLFLLKPLSLIYPALWVLYFSALIISLIQIYVKIKKIKIALATLIYIPLTHLWYGWKFIEGLLKH